MLVCSTTGLASCIGPASTLLSCPRTPYHSPRRSSPQHFQHWFRRLPVSSFGSQRRGADSRRQHNRDSPAHAPTCQRDGGWSLGATESGWVRARPRRWRRLNLCTDRYSSRKHLQSCCCNLKTFLRRHAPAEAEGRRRRPWFRPAPWGCRCSRRTRRSQPRTPRPAPRPAV